MKISFAISLQETNFNYIANNNKWQKRLKLLADLGYDGVELGIKNPASIDKILLEKALKKHRLQLSAIGTGQAYVDDGLSLSSLNAGVRNEAVKRIKLHIDLGALFNAQVIIGLLRGRKENAGGCRGKYEKNLFATVKRVCDYAVSREVVIALEPLNRYETDFLNNAEETLAFIRQIKCKNLKILLDTFHMNIEEKNLTDPMKTAGKYLSHVHLADNNRRCPGEGSIDFKQITGCLKRMGYTGYLSGEMLPLPSAEYCIKEFFRTIKPCTGG